MTYTEQLNIYHPDIIASFLDTGKSDGIPIEIQHFLKQLTFAAELYEYERNISRCAKKLRLRILAEQGINVDIRTCKSRIYAAIEYFDVDCNVSMKVWESNFADRYENLATMCIAKGDYKTAKICQDEAAECRRRSASIAETEKNWAPVYLINNSLTLDDAGFEKKNLKAIAKKHEEGFYLKLIDGLDIDREDKERLKRDAGIVDVESEEINEP